MVKDIELFYSTGQRGFTAKTYIFVFIDAFIKSGYSGAFVLGARKNFVLKNLVCKNVHEMVLFLSDYFCHKSMTMRLFLAHIWVEPARKGKGQKIGNFTLYVLGSLDHLYIFCFAGICHVFEAYRGESYYGIQ